jgi:hypothetical protein
LVAFLVGFGDSHEFLHVEVNPNTNEAFVAVGLSSGRSVRVNYPNFIREFETVPPFGLAGDKVKWSYGPPVPGEGVYECAHRSACIMPNTCTCTDGWTGFDCKTPMCRYCYFSL